MTGEIVNPGERDQRAIARPDDGAAVPRSRTPRSDEPFIAGFSVHVRLEMARADRRAPSRGAAVVSQNGDRKVLRTWGRSNVLKKDPRRVPGGIRRTGALIHSTLPRGMFEIHRPRESKSTTRTRATIGVSNGERVFFVLLSLAQTRAMCWGASALATTR